MENKNVSENSGVTLAVAPTTATLSMSDIIENAMSQTSKMIDIAPNKPEKLGFSKRERRGCACCCDPRGRMCMYGDEKGLINCACGFACFTKKFSRSVYAVVVAMAFVVCAAAAYSENDDGSYNSSYIMPKNFIIAGGMVFIAGAIFDVCASLIKKGNFADAAAKFQSSYNQLVMVINRKLDDTESLRQTLVKYNISQTYRFPNDVVQHRRTVYETTAWMVSITSLIGMIISIAYIYINPLGSLLAIFVVCSAMSWSASAFNYIYSVLARDKKQIFIKMNILAARLGCAPILIDCENSPLIPGEFASVSKVCDRLLI